MSNGGQRNSFSLIPNWIFRDRPEQRLFSTRAMPSSSALNSSTSASSNIQRGPETSFDRVTSFGDIQFSDDFRSKWLVAVKKFLEGHGLFHLWNEILVFLCVIAASLDPLFCYILVIDEKNKCVSWDGKLKIIVVVLRSVTDFIYVVLLIFQFYCCPVTSRSEYNHSVWGLVKRYLSSTFLIDVVSVLPLPQISNIASIFDRIGMKNIWVNCFVDPKVVFLLVIPKLWSSSFWTAMRALKFVLLFQFVPRVLRIYAFLKRVTWTAGIFPEKPGAKAALNLFLYMLASHVFGAFWYLFSVERKISCWQSACRRGTGQVCSLDCNKNSASNSVMYDFCLVSSKKVDGQFKFGIFAPALESGIVNSRDFIKKISFCYWWGLQNLSSFGQNLNTSTFLWEIYFAAMISTFGLVLFAFLIGNLQTYLQTKIARLEEMRLKGQDIELWMAFHSLPRNLKSQIKKYEKFKWRNTKGIDLESLLVNLPRDLRRATKRHLCEIPVMKIPILKNMDQNLLDAIYDYLKPVLYIEHNFIVREGEPLDEMIFITRGQIWTYTTGTNEGRDSTAEYLKKGDFYGTDLLDWALTTPFSLSVPMSTRTVKAHTKVEAFVLKAKDLKIVVSRFWWLFSREMGDLPAFREKWAPFAALVLQAAWRRYCRNKVRVERRNRTAPEEEGSSDLRIAVHGSRFLTRIFRGARHTRAMKEHQDPPESSRV